MLQVCLNAANKFKFIHRCHSLLIVAGLLLCNGFIYTVSGNAKTHPHSQTRTARLTHGHRKEPLTHDFEILRLMPDFKLLCLAGIWQASGAMF